MVEQAIQHLGPYLSDVAFVSQMTTLGLNTFQEDSLALSCPWKKLYARKNVPPLLKLHIFLVIVFVGWKRFGSRITSAIVHIERISQIMTINATNVRYIDYPTY